MRTWSPETSSTNDRPSRRACTRSRSVSYPTTLNPSSEARIAIERPTYPCPTTTTLAVRSESRASRSPSSSSVTDRLLSPPVGAAHEQFGRQAEALRELDHRLVAEVAACGTEVGQAVADVAGSRRGVDRFGAGAEHVTQDVEHLEQRVRTRPGDVVHASRALRRRFSGAEVGVHGVGHEREVPALLTVAVDLWWTAGRDGVEKQRDHGGVPAVRPLPGTVDVEVSEREGLDAEHLREHPAVLLACMFRDGVWRARVRWCGLGGREGCGAAVDARRGAEHDAAHPRVPRGHEHGQGAGDVDPVRLQRVLDGLEHGAASRLVEDDVTACCGRFDRRLVDDVTLDEARSRVDVLSPSRREIVEHDRVGAAVYQRVDEM